jgi:GAF domain-containing protein
MRPTRAQVSGRAILSRAVAEIPDVREDAEYQRDMAVQTGWESLLGVPMLRGDGSPIGVIVIQRTECGTFAAGHIELLKTFADQAVIAVENVRLFTELDARNSELRVALEQQTATSELLKVIGRSTFDLQPVFETLAENAVRLCEAERAILFRHDSQLLRVAAHKNASPEMMAFAERNPIAPGRHSVVARAALERRTVHVQDVRADAEYSYTVEQLDPYRTAMAIPMLRGEELLGVIIINRYEVRPFTDSQIALMETFADQAAIAIENARLLSELQARTGELTRSVKELQALGEVSQALSSTLDLETVLRTIVSRANQLAGTDGGSVYEYDERSEAFHLRATDNLDEEVVAVARHTPVPRSEGVLGRMAATREPVQIADIGREGAYHSPLREVLLQTGTRALLAIPLLRENHLIGGLTVNKKTPGEFSPEIIDVLKTFASQSALGHPERAPVPGDRGQGPPARGGRPSQVGIPGQHVPRAAHAAQRHHRLQRDAPGGRRRPRSGAVHGRSQEDQRGGQAPAGADQRGARSVEDRGGQDGAVPRDLRRRHSRPGHLRGHPAARGEECESPGDPLSG